MAGNGNHEEEAGERRLTCPFLQDWCIDKRCALWIQLFQSKTDQAGKQQVNRVGMCSLPALCEIMSSRQPPPPKEQLAYIVIPGGFLHE